MAKEAGKILVARGGALGDFILTLPVLAALRKRFPKSEIQVLGYPATAALAVASGYADDVKAVESPKFVGFFAAYGSWPEETAAWFAGFETTVSYLHDPQKIFQNNVARCTAGQFIAAPHLPDETLGVHAAEQLLRPLEVLGIKKANPRPRLHLPPVQPEKRLAVHPGSGSEKKNWPEAKWAELLKSLDCQLLLIGGEAEGDRCARLAAQLPPERVTIAQNLPLLALAFKMQDCSAFIGHDSGITHLAAALDLPGLVLWGPSDLTTWRPQSTKMKISRDENGLAALPVETVKTELAAIVAGP
jgi:heptosyltransferase-2